MSLKTLLKSLSAGEVLLPRLKEYLQNIGPAGHRDKNVVIEDARMTIRTLKERMKEYNHDDPIDGEFFHPSALGGCMRAAFFKAKNAPRDAAESDGDDLLRTLMIFETGTYVGILFQNLCERVGLLTRREVPIVDRVNKILGHADGELLIDGIYYILEIKTINARGFYSMTAPKDSHMRQIMAYMHSLNRKWGIIVYLEKDRHSFKEFVVPYDPVFYKNSVRDRIDGYFRSLKTNELPEQEGISPKTMPCSYCPFTTVCYGTPQLEKFMKSLVKKPTGKIILRLK